MKSKPRHPQADRIARVVRRHWTTIPDDLERTKAVLAEALKVFASDTPASLVGQQGSCTLISSTTGEN
jgi:hypothetical protein